ncbi:MAG: NAD-dependent epimerase/dehydratase family protein [Ilumatobacteraceae bacterium]
MATQHAVVAGGAGFIGSHLVERLVADGWSVTVLDSFVTGRRENLGAALQSGSVRLIELDVAGAVDSATGDIAAADLVMNLASPASPSDFLRIPLEILRTGSDGTRHMLELALRLGARFVQASTSEVYGDPEVHPQVETYLGNVDCIGPRSCYDEAKRYGEALTMAYHRVHGVDAAIVRIFNTYGPRMRPDDGRVISTFIDQALRGEPVTVFGDGRQTRSYCYVDDQVSGLLAVARSGHLGPFNVGMPVEHSVLDVAQFIVELCESSSEIKHLPIPLERSGDPRCRRPDITRVRVECGWEPVVDLGTGLRRMIDEARQRLANGR